MSKEALIKARVNQATKDAIARIAADRGEAEAVIIREALNALVMKETAAAPPMPEPLAFLAVVLFVLQFWLLTRIPGIRRFLARPIVK